MKARLVLAAAVMIMLAGPALAQSKAIQKLNDEWAAAFNKGDAGAAAVLYTADAYVLPPGAPMVKGRADIQKFWAGAMQHHGDIKLTTLDVKPLGPDAAREKAPPLSGPRAPTRRTRRSNMPSSGRGKMANGAAPCAARPAVRARKRLA
jgi:uncharacterized protein (TIGR02246 family)